MIAAVTTRCFVLVSTLALASCERTEKAAPTPRAAAIDDHDEAPVAAPVKTPVAAPVAAPAAEEAPPAKKVGDIDFEGYIPLADSKAAIAKLESPNEIVLASPKALLLVDYPVTNETLVPITAKDAGGFRRAELAAAISKAYREIYAEEERTSAVPVIPLEKRGTPINRNRTEGKYGIWGHDLEDLMLHSAEVFENTQAGEPHVLVLGIDS
jgi:hypothetical protein